MREIILHHYPQSPVSEKVRVVLGIKNLDWFSVTIPRLPPKPDLMPLTGGYRRTPVMQVGADIYCDSLCIIRELERRFPNPGLLSEANGEMEWGFARWIDGPLFSSAITVVLGTTENLPEDFAADRGRLYFGSNFKLSQLQRSVHHHAAQIFSQFTWAESRLEGGQEFLGGKSPTLLDVLWYYIAWFLRGRWTGGADLIAGFPLVCGWEKRIEQIGHGHPRDMDSLVALGIARESEVRSDHLTVVANALGIGKTDLISVVPEGDGGDPGVIGELQGLSANEICLSRQDDQIGEVLVHFPRVGYQVMLVQE